MVAVCREGIEENSVASANNLGIIKRGGTSFFISRCSLKSVACVDENVEPSYNKTSCFN